MMMNIDIVLTAEVVKEVGYQVITSPFFYFLIGSMFIDLITGMGKAFITGTYSSSIGTDGVVKHSMVLLLTIFITFFFRLFGISPIGIAIKIVLSFNYLVSIIENIESTGVVFPESIKKLFLQMKDKAEGEIIRAEDVNVVITNNKNRKHEDSKKGVDR